MDNEIFENIYRQSVLEEPLDSDTKTPILSEDFAPYVILNDGNDDFDFFNQNQLFEQIFKKSRK